MRDVCIRLHQFELGVPNKLTTDLNVLLYFFSLLNIDLKITWVLNTKQFFTFQIIQWH